MAPGVARGGGGGRGRGRGGGRGHGRGDNGGGGDTQSQNTGESQPSFVSVRGSNILDQVPSDPKKRKFIEVESNDEFSDHPAVIRDITCILKTMFRGTWDSWKSIDKDDREAMWRLFKGMYEWPEETDGLARKVWEICMKKRIPDTLKKARDAALAAAREANVNVSMQGDLTFLKPHKPNWIKENDWHSLIDTVWNKPKWKNLSRSATENRNKLQDGSVSKHCAGSISTKQHKKRMEVELERLPSGVEVYSKLHIQKSTQQYITPKAARVQEAYEEAIVAKYGDDTSCYPLLDSQIWLEVSGGKKKGRVFGFGSISDPESFLTGTSSTATSREKKTAEMEAKAAEMEAKAAEMEAKAAEMEVKHHKMCEELDAKAAALEVKQKQIDEKYERFEKMFYELQNMRES